MSVIIYKCTYTITQGFEDCKILVSQKVFLKEMTHGCPKSYPPETIIKFSSA